MVAASDPREQLALRSHPRYAFVKYISSGSFGSVVLAEDKIAGGHVALKFIPRQKVAQNGYAKAEVLNHMILRHPHIIQLHEVFLTDEHLVLVLEYADGGDLANRVGAGGMPESDARWIFAQLLFALDYCHRCGVASRDIKLENVLLTSFGAAASSNMPIVKLADFGLSLACGPHGRGRYYGPVGTPLYFAPETLASPEGHEYDAKATDVWAAGVLLYILLTGACPFQRASDAKLSRKERMATLFQRIQRVDYWMPSHVSPACQHLLSRMLVADPARRATVSELMQMPWCWEGMQAEAMLQCNNTFVQATCACPPSPELVREVHSIVQEAGSMASLRPATPRRGCPPARRTASGSLGPLGDGLDPSLQQALQLQGDGEASL